MFADIAKIALKTALIAAVTGLIVAGFADFKLPSIDAQYFIEAVGHGKAIVAYWVPPFAAFLEFGIRTLELIIVLLGVNVALLAFRWILKVNE